jgi:hypothetical protein
VTEKKRGAHVSWLKHQRRKVGITINPISKCAGGGFFIGEFFAAFRKERWSSPNNRAARLLSAHCKCPAIRVVAVRDDGYVSRGAPARAVEPACLNPAQTDHTDSSLLACLLAGLGEGIAHRAPVISYDYGRCMALRVHVKGACRGITVSYFRYCRGHLLCSFLPGLMPVFSRLTCCLNKGPGNPQSGKNRICRSQKNNTYNYLFCMGRTISERLSIFYCMVMHQRMRGSGFRACG